MYIQVEYTLFYDPQAAAPEEFCIACGCECYAPGMHCIHCERRGEYDSGGIEPVL